MNGDWAALSAHLPMALLALLCLGATITDVREQKIYNLWVYPFMLAGLLCGLSLGGGAGLVEAMKGLLLGFVLLFPLFASGAYGAGDGKFAMAIGSLMGWKFVLSTFLYSLVAALPLCLLIIWWDSRTLGGFLAYWALLKKETEAKTSRKDSVRSKMPFGVGIALGAILAARYPLFR